MSRKALVSALLRLPADAKTTALPSGVIAAWSLAAVDLLTRVVACAPRASAAGAVMIGSPRTAAGRLTATAARSRAGRVSTGTTGPPTGCPLPGGGQIHGKD